MNETLLGGRYRLLDTVGAGGEARVFRARDEDTGCEVAVRLGLENATYQRPDDLPTHHPGWVHFLDSGAYSLHGAYQVYELLQGRTLSQLAAAGPLDETNWRDLVRQSLESVEALHQAGWIHGDLNADNFFHVETASSSWKLLELPFLRFDPPEGRSALFGSIHTLAPEQLNGTPADARSDLYALGCLYYLAAAGVWPQTGANRQEIAIDRLRFVPEPLHEKAPHLPANCSAWVMKLLERQPEDRFPSVTAAHQLLDA